MNNNIEIVQRVALKKVHNDVVKIRYRYFLSSDFSICSLSILWFFFSTKILCFKTLLLAAAIVKDLDPHGSEILCMQRSGPVLKLFGSGTNFSN